MHIPHNYRHADLLHCVSGITMGGRAGRTGSILPPDRSDVMSCIEYLFAIATRAQLFAVALRCAAVPPFYSRARCVFPDVASGPQHHLPDAPSISSHVEHSR